MSSNEGPSRLYHYLSSPQGTWSMHSSSSDPSQSPALGCEDSTRQEKEAWVRAGWGVVRDQGSWKPSPESGFLLSRVGHLRGEGPFGIPAFLALMVPDQVSLLQCGVFAASALRSFQEDGDTWPQPCPLPGIWLARILESPSIKKPPLSVYLSVCFVCGFLKSRGR